MAPDITKKKTKVCKKYAYSEHSKYSKWEKERRDRFNMKLEELASCLPNYKKETTWKKVEIVENAIINMRNKSIVVNKAHEETIKKLSAEVNQLKNIILEFTGFTKSSEDIYKITSREISTLLRGLINNKKDSIETAHDDILLEDEENLAFVAKIAQSNDHCYSMQVSEPNLEVDSEEVVETIDLSGDGDDNIDMNNTRHVAVQESTTLTDKPIMIDLVGTYNLGELNSSNVPNALHQLNLIDSQNTNLSIPQIINLQDLNGQNLSLSNLKGSNVTTIFVNKGSRASLLQQPSVLSGTKQDALNTNLVSKIAIPRLKVNKKMKPKRKTYSRRRKPKEKSLESNEQEQNNKENESLELDISQIMQSEKGKPQPALKLSDDHKKPENQIEIEEGENNNINETRSLEKEIIDLQNNEEIEMLEETIKEDTEKSKKDAQNKDTTKTKVEKSLTNNSEAKKKLETNKKKSKSSYSIAALCQISVNIGDRPEMANSPGVMSLNSVGTISPANTPAPTPDTIKSFGIDTCNIVIDNHPVTEDPVIEELNPIRPEDVSLLQQIEVNTTMPSQNSETFQGTKKAATSNISPSQNFLSNFPVVSKPNDQQQSDNISSPSLSANIYQALKDLDTELNLETDGKDPDKTSSIVDSKSPYKSIPTTQESLKTPCKEVVSKVSSPSKPILTASKIPAQTSPPTQPSKTVSVSTTSTKTTVTPTCSALSIYDFSATKPDTPPIPLQKSRIKENKPTSKPSRSNDENLKPYRSPEKKTYTEMQTKPKKSPHDAKIKFSESRKNNENANQQMPAHQQPNLYTQSNLSSMDANYDTRVHQHQQDTLMHRQNLKHSSTNYHQPPTTYNSQHPVTRHSYMAPHYPYQSMVPSQHTNPNIHPYHHTTHPYNHPPVPIAESDMKTQFHHSSKYSCSSHGSYLAPNVPDFHARNYYTGSKHYVPSNSHYRNFHSTNEVPQPGQEVGHHYGADRKRAMPLSHHQMDMNHVNHQDRQTSAASMSLQQDKAASSAVHTSGTTFSVTHLVNTNQQKKGNKRSSTAASKPSKQARTDSSKDGRQIDKDDCRKPTRATSTRRNKSGTRSNYSAESLISSSGATTQTIAENRDDNKMKIATSPTKNSSPKGNTNVDKNYTGTTRANSNWSNDVNHFGGLQFSSLSPSPASLLPTDLSSIDFPLFGPQDVNLGNKEYLQGSSSQNNKSTNKQQPTCQLGNQRSAVTDWTLNPAILDNSFLPPLPTLTPPNDPMSDPMTGYSFMSPMSHSHSGFYPCASAPQAPPRIQNQSYSAHSAANIPVSGYTQAMTAMSKTGVGGHHSFPPSQMVAIPPLAAGGNSQTGSLVNFNLSTIFPEINIPPAGQPNCQVKSTPGIPPLPPPGGMDFLQNTRPGQLATPDLLPHSIAFLGHTSHQVMPSFSVATNMVPGISFPNIPEQ